MTGTLSKFYASDAALRDAKRHWTDLFDIQLAYEDAIRAVVDALSREDAERLARDADMFSSTNCGWYEYRAMHNAAAEARWRIQHPAAAEARRIATGAEPEPVGA